MTKKKIATIWMDGCSGCHMSFLDIDHRLLDLADLIEIVHSPLVDHKDFPSDVDVTLVEGAVSSDEDYEKILKVRARTKILVSMGDCAVNANVPAMRNRFTPKALNEAIYTPANSARHGANVAATGAPGSCCGESRCFCAGLPAFQRYALLRAERTCSRTAARPER